MKAVNSLQSEQLNIRYTSIFISTFYLFLIYSILSKISHIPENNDPTSLNVSALKNMLAEEKIKMDKKHKNTNSNNNNNNQQDGEERISEFATSPKRTEMTEKQVRKRLINERVGEKENDDTNNISINNSNINNKNNERETSFSRPFEYREAKERIQFFLLSWLSIFLISIISFSIFSFSSSLFLFFIHDVNKILQRIIKD